MITFDMGGYKRDGISIILCIIQSRLGVSLANYMGVDWSKVVGLTAED